MIENIFFAIPLITVAGFFLIVIPYFFYDVCGGEAALLLFMYVLFAVWLWLSFQHYGVMINGY